MAVVSFRRVRGAFSRSSSFRLSLLMGTALALPAAAHAENIAFNGTGDYSLTRTDTVAGGPATINIVTDGAINLNLTDVTVASSSGNGTGIGANTTRGAGNITINSGSVTATGTSSIYNIDARSSTGNIVITSNSSTSQANPSSRAIYAVSDNGNITIDSTVAIAAQRGIHTGSVPGNPSGTIGNGIVTIRSILADATGVSSPNAIIGQGRVVDITSGETRLSNVQGATGAAIFVQANESSKVKSDIVTTSGTNQAGIQVNSGGASTIESDTITMAGNNADAIKTFANGIVDITSGTIVTTGATTSGRGIVVGSNGARDTAALIKVKSTSITMSGSNATGIVVDAAGSPTTIDSGTITADNGISATNTVAGTLSITSGTINAKSLGVNVQSGTGAVTINSTSITNSGAGANAIRVNGNGPVTITSGEIANNGNAITVSGDGANTAATSVTSTSITGSGSGISISGRGAITLNSGTVALTSTATQNVNTLNGSGISVIALAGDSVINSGSVVFTGTGNVLGISAQAVGTSNSLTINSRDVTVTGNGGYGILGSTVGAALTINSTGTVKTVGTTRSAGGNLRPADGIDAISQTGAITVNNSGSISTAGANARGIAIDAGRAIQNFGTPSTAASTSAIKLSNTGSIATAGNFANGINILADENVVTVSGTGSVKTAGEQSVGIAVSGTTGAVSVEAGSVETAGVFGNGVDIRTTTGAVAVKAGTVKTTGASAYGIFATTQGDASVTAGSVSVASSDRGAIDVQANNATISVQTVSAAQSTGINVIANTSTGGIADISAASITANGAGKSAVAATGANIKLNLGTVNSTGSTVTANGGTTRADAVTAFGFLAKIDATIGSVTKTGDGSDAVRLTSSAAPQGFTVVQQQASVSTTVTGAVSATGGNGVFISSADLASLNIAAGASVSGSTNGVSIRGLTNTIVNAGTVSNTGTGQAIVANGKTSLDNSGTINAGSGGTAVRLSTLDDVVTLRTGSVVNGTIAGNGGVDQAVLNGTIGVQTTAQTVAAFSGFTGLTVAGGYWTAGATASNFANVTVNNGATLEVAGAATGGLTGVVASNYVADGTLAIRSVGNTGVSTLGSQTVSGAGRVLFVGGTSTLDGTNSIATTGGVAVDNGATVVLTGTQGGIVNVLTGGTFSIGNGGTSGLFTGNANVAGTLVVNHSDDYTFGGALTGAGTLVKNGAGKLTLGTGYAFTGTTSILGGSIRLAGTVAPTTELDLTGTGTLDFSGTRQVVAELQGNSPAASISVAQGGALTVNQTTSTAFAGAITGDGSLAKTGAGTLNLTGNSTYTGPTTVTGGKLAVNGSIVSPVTVSGGGKLGGTGRVGNVTIGAGGAYAPGNSIGTQNVAGNVVFAAGSTYEVETNADGRSDRIIATGTANIAANTTVAVLAEAGNYNRLTSYNILSATGGVTGTFTNVTSNFAFLTPSLSYTGTAVTLRLLRNDVTFASLARTPNQLAVANAIAAQGFSGAIYNAAIMLSNAATPGAYSELSGELFAAVPSVLIDQSRRIRGSVLDRAGAQGEGWGVWGQAGRAGIETDATGNVAATATDRTTVLSGVDYGMGAWRVGLHAGYVDSNVGVKGRASQADVHTKLVGAYGRWSQDKLTVKIGGDYSWHDIDTTRSLSIPGLNGQERSSYDATSQQVFGEVSYALIDGPVTAAPFGGLAYVRTHTDRAVETGNAAALTVASRTRDIKLATAGWHLGGSAPIGTSATLLPHLTASAQYAWGDLRGGSVAQFGGAGQAFGVSGARLAQATYGLDGGVDVQFGRNVKAGIGGFMSTSRDWSDFGGNVSVSFAF